MCIQITAMVQKIRSLNELKYEVHSLALACNSFYPIGVEPFIADKDEGLNHGNDLASSSRLSHTPPSASSAAPQDPHSPLTAASIHGPE
jgi:hypothetical protein